MKRGINGLLLILAVLLCLPLGGSAHDVPEERKDCSIELLIRYDGEDITGGTLKAVKVGYVDQEDGNFFFYQEMTGEKLEDVASPEAAQKLKEFYDDNKDDYDFYTQIQTVTEGKSQFKNLTTGLYLIVQDNAAEGFSKLDAFLVGVPMMVEGEYQYHVTAAVKSELERTHPGYTSCCQAQRSQASSDRTAQLAGTADGFRGSGTVSAGLGPLFPEEARRP